MEKKLSPPFFITDQEVHPDSLMHFWWCLIDAFYYCWNISEWKYFNELRYDKWITLETTGSTFIQNKPQQPIKLLLYFVESSPYSCDMTSLLLCQVSALHDFFYLLWPHWIWFMNFIWLVLHFFPWKQQHSAVFLYAKCVTNSKNQEQIQINHTRMYAEVV